MSQRIGEVIESSSAEFTAECYELYDIPPLGGLVKVNAPPLEIYGIVCQSGTAGIETGRRPIARGKEEASEDAIYQTSPQLVKLLRSEFRVIVVGYQSEGKIYQYLPSKPVHIHSFVQVCSPEEIKHFSQSFEFLGILAFAHIDFSMEELIAATLREMSRVQSDPRAFLVASGKILTNVLSGEYQRLKTILARLKQ